MAKASADLSRPPKPTALQVIPDAIPSELTALPQWVVWRYTWLEDRQKWDKPPLRVRNGNEASSTNPKTWGTFEDAIWTYETGLVNGIGFVFVKLDFGHFPSNEIAGKWQPAEGFMAGAWEAESFRDVYLPTRLHLISGRRLPPLAWSATGGFLNGQSRVKQNRLVGIDLDHCRNPETGVIAPWALGIIHRFDTYTELSPSGTGVHLIAAGTLHGHGIHKPRGEMYDTGRYFTVTGRRLEVPR